MGVNLAPDFWHFVLVSLFELLYIIIPLYIMKKQGKSPLTEFKKYLFPTLRSLKKRFVDITIGLFVGWLFYEYAGWISYAIYLLVIKFQTKEVYQTASEGSVNTTPPPPPPEISVFWLYFQIIVGILLMFFIVALSEEFCYRGVIYKELRKNHPVLSVIGTSVLFGLYHVFPGVVPLLTTIVFFPYYFSFGLLLTLIVWLNRDDLLMAIIAHGTFNSIILVHLLI